MDIISFNEAFNIVDAHGLAHQLLIEASKDQQESPWDGGCCELRKLLRKVIKLLGTEMRDRAGEQSDQARLALIKITRLFGQTGLAEGGRPWTTLADILLQTTGNVVELGTELKIPYKLVFSPSAEEVFGVLDVNRAIQKYLAPVIALKAHVGGEKRLFRVSVPTWESFRVSLFAIAFHEVAHGIWWIIENVCRNLENSGSTAELHSEVKKLWEKWQMCTGEIKKDVMNGFAEPTEEAKKELYRIQAMDEDNLDYETLFEASRNGKGGEVKYAKRGIDLGQSEVTQHFSKQDALNRVNIFQKNAIERLNECRETLAKHIAEKLTEELTADILAYLMVGPSICFSLYEEVMHKHKDQNKWLVQMMNVDYLEDAHPSIQFRLAQLLDAMRSDCKTIAMELDKIDQDFAKIVKEMPDLLLGRTENEKEDIVIVEPDGYGENREFKDALQRSVTDIKEELKTYRSAICKILRKGKLITTFNPDHVKVAALLNNFRAQISDKSFHGQGTSEQSLGLETTLLVACLMKVYAIASMVDELKNGMADNGDESEVETRKKDLFNVCVPKIWEMLCEIDRWAVTAIMPELNAISQCLSDTTCGSPEPFIPPQEPNSTSEPLRL